MVTVLLTNKATSDHHAMPETPEEKTRRFQIELEFVQCLANPWYLHHLAQQEYLKDPAFINYLDYLQYWKRPEYAKFIIYPHALHFLDLLQHPAFRDKLILKKETEAIHQTQYYHWAYYRNPPRTQGAPEVGAQQQQQQQQELANGGPAADGAAQRA
ncbi:SOH1 family protein [Jimgerdemannia flammicorona]|uniref:Mediator of RNA polymerase II transcription subunit 31 n=1 Tax=Jimgerdemannia flammicorona TaxID=994334 RepID=A0A433DFR3_9FUNG|nr:SOH1 family protein [Jimgerdemannia flammicorona]